MELSAWDRAISIGALMGEETNLAGMGIVAASALNRADTPGRFASRSASLGDVFSAPHSTEAMLASVLNDVGIARSGRQYSATINANIPGASTDAYEAFERGIKAALGDVAALGAYASRYERANVALDVAVKARDMGIDLGFGATNYGTPGFAQKAGVGSNPARFGSHSIGPFEKNEKAPKQADFAARFAAAAALTGVSIPEAYRQEVERYATPTQISMAASVMQKQAQEHLAQQGVEAFPGMSYGDLVQPMGRSAVDVRDVTGQLGISPMGPLGFAEYSGFTPDNYESMGLPDPVGQVDSMGPVSDITPYENINPVSFNQAMGPPIGDFDWGGLALNDFSTDPLQAGFSLPDQAYPSFDDVSLNSYPDITAGTAFDPMTGFSPVDAAPVNFSDVDVGSYPEMTEGTYDPASWSADFSPAPADFSDVQTPSVSGFSAGVDGWSAPETYTPDMSTARDALAAQGRIDSFADHQLPGISHNNQEQINDSVMAELAPKSTPAPSAFSDMSTPDLEAASLQNEKDMGTLNQTAVTGWGATPSGLMDQEASLTTTPTAPGAVGFGSFGSFSAPATQGLASAPTVAQGDFEQAAPQRSAPTRSAPQQTQRSASQDLGPTLPSADYQGMVDSTFGVGKPGSGFMDAMVNPTMADSYGQPVAKDGFGDFGLGNLFGKSTPDAGFMNAMSSQQHANAYSPGMLDGWTGQALKGAAFGALTGGLPGALIGGAFGAANLDGRLGSAFTNQFGGFGDWGSSWAGYDPTTMGYGFGYNDRGERSHTGVDNSGNASVGDGSYGSESGRNDNNPQGIL